eukprot:scaffold3076_cov117-Isochrysis_galbana.AAC.12
MGGWSVYSTLSVSGRREGTCGTTISRDFDAHMDTHTHDWLLVRLLEDHAQCVFPHTGYASALTGATLADVENLIGVSEGWRVLARAAWVQQSSRGGGERCAHVSRQVPHGQRGCCHSRSSDPPGFPVDLGTWRHGGAECRARAKMVRLDAATRHGSEAARPRGAAHGHGHGATRRP